MQLYTIGYSRFPMPEFLKTMKDHGIATVVDVRSVPYSARFKNFNRDMLNAGLKAEGLSYLWLGDSLGGLKENKYVPIATVADMQAKLDENAFRKGCDILREKLEEAPVCLLCAENDPLNCHRAIIVSHLFRKLECAVSISHIWKGMDEVITIESQQDLDERALTGFKGDGVEDQDSAYAALNAKFTRRKRRP